MESTGPYPLDMGSTGTGALECSWNSGGSTWNLLMGLIVAVHAHLWSPQWSSSSCLPLELLQAVSYCLRGHTRKGVLMVVLPFSSHAHQQWHLAPLNGLGFF